LSRSTAPVSAKKAQESFVQIGAATVRKNF